MIDTIALAIKAKLESLQVFRAVEQTITRQILQTPPGAAIFLAADKEKSDKPVKRELAWDVMLSASALGVGGGQATIGGCIDAVRKGLLGWRALESGGVLPAKIPLIKLEGVQNTLLIYSVRLTMEVMPDVIDS
jgi:hypothetical protein